MVIFMYYRFFVFCFLFFVFCFLFFCLKETVGIRIRTKKHKLPCHELFVPVDHYILHCRSISVRVMLYILSGVDGVSLQGGRFFEPLHQIPPAEIVRIFFEEFHSVHDGVEHSGMRSFLLEPMECVVVHVVVVVNVRVVVNVGVFHDLVLK
jgi:hypothetical protein